MAKATESLFPGLFLGEFDHTLDPQCRVTLPSDWRSCDGSTELVLIPTRGKALILLPIQTFLEFVEKAKKQAIANPKVQMAFAWLGANSRQCRSDKQGRVALDRKMLDRIEISTKVKLIGAVTHIRLTAPENWELPTDEEQLGVYLDEIQKAGDQSDDIAGLLGGILGKG